MAHNNAILDQRQASERRFEKYHDCISSPLMVSLILALPAAENTIKNTIDDADYIINGIFFIYINQCLADLCHSHSIVNEPFLWLKINALVIGICGNTMINTMLRKSFKKLGKIAD